MNRRVMMLRTPLLLVAAVAAMGASAGAGEKAPDIALSLPQAVAGEELVVLVRVPPGRLEAVYAPNAAVEHREVIERATEDGQTFQWTPKQAGIVRLEAYVLEKKPGDPDEAKAEKPFATKDLSVAFDGVPGAGIVILLLAGGILFGGAFVAMRSILKS